MKLVRTATLLAAVLTLWGHSAAAATPGVTKTEIVIGTVQDLSGPIAAFGKDTLDGMKLRIAEINEQGGIHGRKLKLLSEDSGYDPKRAVLATQKMVNLDGGIFAMTGLMGSAPAIAAMPVLLDAGVVSFMPMSSARPMFEPVHKLKFGFSQPNFDGQRSNAPRLFKTSKSTKACILYQDDEFGLEIFRGAEAGFKDIGISFTDVTTYKRGATDFASQVARMKQAGCDFVVMGTQIRETVGTISEMRKLGYNPTMVGSASTYTDLIPKLGGKAMDGLYADMWAKIPYVDDASQPVRFWASKFKTMFDREATIFGAYGYMIVDRLASGLQKTGPNLTTEGFVKAMETLTIEPDMFGSPRLTFSPTKHIGSLSTRISQLQNGRWEVVYDYPKGKD
ncbi:MAG: ABC transporter substrate-binding protein [Burkholderiales bacterium]